MTLDPLEEGSAAEIAAGARAAWRAEEDEWTQAAFERWQHERTILDVLREVMHRGDVVSVDLGQVTYRGRVCAVGDDFFSLDVGATCIDVHVVPAGPLLVRVVDRAHAGGTRGADVTTFRARLLDLETSTTDVEIGTTSGASAAHGCVRVGRDHVIVRERGGDDLVVPLDTIGWVRPRVAPA